MHARWRWGGREYRLERAQWVPQAPAEVFPFFEDPHNLPKITPAWLDFKILKMEPDRIQAGTLIDYSLRWFGVRYRWRTLIESWEPNVSFVDTQIHGPYVLWHHTHTFEAVDGGTLLKDVVRYRLPFGPFGMVSHALLVRRQLEGIFDYRMARIAEAFSGGVIQNSKSKIQNGHAE